MGQAWRGWFHVVGSTYGAWLPGDERGFRTRHHREHVQGDYKNRPTGSREHLHEHARASMKGDAVVFPREVRSAVSDYLIEALDHHNIEFAALCVAATHFHVLIRFPPSPPPPGGGTVGGGNVGGANLKVVVGRLKSWVTYRMKQDHADAVPPAGAGGLWGKGMKVVPINDEGHFGAVRGYIGKHQGQGAEVVLR